MGGLLADVRAFLCSIWNSWLSLMSGILGVVVWVLGATIEPMPVSLRWTFLGCGAIALLVAAFVVWRNAYREARPYEKETFEHAGVVFTGLSEGAKDLLRQMVIRKSTVSEGEARQSGLADTDFLVQVGDDFTFGRCRLHSDYAKIVSRLVKDWRRSKGV